MKGEMIVMISALLLISAVPMAMGSVGIDGEADPEMNSELMDFDGRTAEAFIENTGQWDDEVLFHSVTDFGSISITEDGIVYNTISEKGEETGIDSVSLSFEGGSMERTSGMEKLDTTYNYFIGKDPARWKTSVPSYQKVKVTDLWDGIDLEYYLNDEGLKYDLVLSPYSDVSDIHMELDGVERIRVSPDTMIMDLDSGISLNDGGLKAFHDDGSGEGVDVDFMPVSDNGYTFKVSGWDRSRPLRIDPIVYATFIGGMHSDSSTGMAVDDNGDFYLTGYSNSLNYPVTQDGYSGMNSGIMDGIISKMDSTGSNLMYSTFFGGSDLDQLFDIEMDPDGGFWAVGHTKSDDIPTSDNAFNDTRNGSEHDIMILKFDSTGTTLEYSSYLGGTASDTFLGNRVLAVDSDGNAVFAGKTSSDNFPMTDDAYDSSFGMMTWEKGFITKIDPTSSELVYSTYLGGSMSNDIRSLVMDDDGYIYVSGDTRSMDFPTTTGAYQETLPGMSGPFITKFDMESATPLIYSTFYAGMDSTTVSCIDVDDQGQVYITGRTRDGALPLTEDAYQTEHRGSWDVYVTKFNAQGSDLIFSTFFGGTDDDHGNAITATRDGGACVVGRSESGDLYSMMNYTVYDPPTDYSNAFIISVDEEGKNANYVSVFGGMMGDLPSEVYLESNGDAVIYGRTDSDDFPVTKGAYNTGYQGGDDLFLMRMNMTLPPGMVRDFTVEQMDGKLNISWKEPLVDGGLPIDGYRIYRGELPSVIGLYNHTDGENHFIDEDVIVSERYYYRVSAYNGAGEGQLTTIKSSYAVSRPGAPINLRLESGDSYVRLEWNRPYVTGDLDIQSYRIYRDNGSGEAVLVNETGSTFRSYLDSGVENGVEYEYWMTTVNRIGESDPTDRYETMPKGLPSSPTNINITVINGTVMISWDPPVDDGGIGIEGYEVLKVLSDSSSSVIEVLDRMTFVDRDVSLGSEYTYALRCFNSLGRSEPTDPVKVVVKDIPDSPVGVVVSEGKSLCTIYWEAPASTGGVPLSGYKIYRSVEDGEMELIAEVEPSDQFYTDHDVENGVTYSYAISAYNEVGESVISALEDATPSGRPGIPTTVTVTQVNSTLVIEWNPPGDNGGSLITAYHIERSLDGKEIVFEVSGDQDEYVDSDIEAGVSYSYTVRALNAMGRSDESEPIVKKLITAPGAPESLSVEQSGDAVMLSWIAPTFDGGSAIESYKILRMSNDSGEMELLETVDAGDRTYLDFEIEPGVNYTYSVKAVNSRGESESSSMADITPTTVPDAPGKPVLLEDGHVEISWSEPISNGGQSLIRYRIERSVEGGEFEMIGTNTPDRRTFVDHDIDDGLEYSYRIIAVNAQGASEPSEAASISVSEEKVSGLESVSAGTYTGIIILLLVIVIILIVILLASRKKKEEEIPQPTASNMPYAEQQTEQYGSSGYQEGMQTGQVPYQEQGYGGHEYE